MPETDQTLTLLELGSLVWFFLCWAGYTRYSGLNKRGVPRLQDALFNHILQWIDVLQRRDNRIADTSVIANIERSSTFLASSSLLVIAATLTAAGSSESVLNLLSELPFIGETTKQTWEIGLFILLLTYAYAFFTFTWCMRQWGFASIMIGSTPLPNDNHISAEERQEHIDALAQMIKLAVYHFNLGLRAYYFSLAIIGWFINPVVFMLSSAWIVGVLYRREFHSRTLKALQKRSTKPA